MRPPRAVLLVAVVSLVAISLVPAGSVAPPPEGVCGICGPEFERAAEEHGVNATVTESDLTVEIDADGTSHWTASATLNRAAAARFAENRTLLYHAVARTYSSYRTAVDEPENLSVSLDGRTVTATFSVADAAHRYPGGVVVFDGFARQPPDGQAYVDADTLTVAGPSGTAVTHAPSGSSIAENRAVWTAGNDGRTRGPSLGRQATVAFAGDGGLSGQAVTAAAVRTHALGAIESELREYALFPAVLLGSLAAGLLLAGGRLPSTLARGRTLARWLAAGAGLYVSLVALVFLLAGDDPGVALGIVGIGLAPQAFLTALASLLVDSPSVTTDRNVPRIAVVSVLVWTLALVLGAPLSALLVLVAGPLVFLPFGVLAGAERPLRASFPFVAALGPVVAALPFVPQIGLVVVTPTMLAALSIGTALLGVPLFATGRRLGNRRTDSASPTERSRNAVR